MAKSFCERHQTFCVRLSLKRFRVTEASFLPVHAQSNSLLQPRLMTTAWYGVLCAARYDKASSGRWEPKRSHKYEDFEWVLSTFCAEWRKNRFRFLFPLIRVVACAWFSATTCKYFNKKNWEAKLRAPTNFMHEKALRNPQMNGRAHEEYQEEKETQK